MSPSRATVICLCYNHEHFVVEALCSVLNQSHPNIQLIVVDDKSSDGSVNVIEQFLKNKPAVTFIRHEANKGSCASFNEALSLANGDFVIDLAADDVLLPDRVAKGIEALQASGETYGVHFSDAEMINEAGAFLSRHSDRFPHAIIPQGDVYKELIHRYFICSPTVMYRKTMLDELSGYDETLAFEDFDFWIRSSRNYKYVYSSEVLMKRRRVNNSMSQKQFKKASDQRWSTLKVCMKIKALNKAEEENKALKSRLHYEIRVSLKLFDFKLAFEFLKLRMSL